jgi:hypothetical protein
MEFTCELCVAGADQANSCVSTQALMWTHTRYESVPDQAAGVAAW